MLVTVTNSLDGLLPFVMLYTADAGAEDADMSRGIALLRSFLSQIMHTKGP